MTASLMAEGRQSYTDDNGVPLAGGKLYTYAAGTSTPLATYSDPDGLVPNTNPVILDARGEATVFWSSSAYKVMLTDAADTPVWTQDKMYTRGLVTATGAVTARSLEDHLATLPDSKITATGAVTPRYLADHFATLPDTKITATGSTTGRGLADRARDVVSLKDFGAVGDGVANDTTAVQAALDSGATYIHAAAGTYKVGDLTADQRGLVLYGDGIDATVFDYSGSGNVFTLAASQMKFRDFTVDGNGTTGSIFQTSESASANTSGVFEWDNVRGTDAANFIVFGQASGDANQADSYIRRCAVLRMSGSGVKVVHDQGVNYLFSMNTFAEITGSAINFQKGGKMAAYQNSFREVGTVFEIKGAGENSDYFDIRGVSIDGSTGTAYPQWHKLLDATRGRISISGYSSGNSGATPTDPLITLNGYGEVRFTDSQVLPVYTWNGSTGIPVVYLAGASTSTTASLFVENIVFGSSSAGSPATWATFLDRVNAYTYVDIRNVKGKGQIYATEPDIIIGGALTVSGSSDQAIPFFDQLTYVPVIGNYNPTQLAVTLLTGSITGGQTVAVKLQRNRGGLANLTTFTLTSATTFPAFLINAGDRIDPQWNYQAGDQIRISINDNSTGATPKLGFALGLSKG